MATHSRLVESFRGTSISIRRGLRNGGLLARFKPIVARVTGPPPQPRRESERYAARKTGNFVRFGLPLAYANQPDVVAARGCLKISFNAFRSARSAVRGPRRRCCAGRFIPPHRSPARRQSPSHGCAQLRHTQRGTKVTTEAPPASDTEEGRDTRSEQQT